MGKGAEEGLYLARAGRKFLVNFTYHIEESNLGWGVGGKAGQKKRREEGASFRGQVICILLKSMMLLFSRYFVLLLVKGDAYRWVQLWMPAWPLTQKKTKERKKDRQQTNWRCMPAC